MEEKKTLSLKDLGHIGIVVRDVEKAADFYTATLGIGPFHIFELTVPAERTKEKAAAAKLKLGMAQLGQITFELIEVVEGETIHKEFLDAKGEGLHHLGFDVADLDQELVKLERHGISVLTAGKFAGGGFAYLDSKKTNGVIIELVQREPR